MTCTCIFFVQILYVTKQHLPVVIWRSDSCSTLFRVMVCCLLGTKPLPAPMLAYCWIDHWQQSLVIFESKYRTILPGKCFWKSPFQRDDSRRIFYSGKCRWWFNMEYSTIMDIKPDGYLTINNECCYQWKLLPVLVLDAIIWHPVTNSRVPHMWFPCLRA